MSKHKGKAETEDKESGPMTFTELLEYKDAAIRHEEDCAAKVIAATAAHELAMTEAQAEVARAEAAAAAAAASRISACQARTAVTREAVARASSEAYDATIARLEAQQAIFDELANKGDMYVTEADGSIAVYKAREISVTSPGWTVTHPIPGS